MPFDISLPTAASGHSALDHARAMLAERLKLYLPDWQGADGAYARAMGVASEIDYPTYRAVRVAEVFDGRLPTNAADIAAKTGLPEAVISASMQRMLRSRVLIEETSPMGGRKRIIPANTRPSPAPAKPSHFEKLIVPDQQTLDAGGMAILPVELTGKTGGNAAPRTHTIDGSGPHPGAISAYIVSGKRLTAAEYDEHCRAQRRAKSAEPVGPRVRVAKPAGSNR